ncbi:MAG: hypothetical protein AAFU70_08215, partial [Planctomycetota bacterium]
MPDARATFATLLMLVLGVSAPAMISTDSAAAVPPQPKPIPTRWEFDIRVVQPMEVAIVDSPRTGPKPYFFLTYQVTNYSDRDRPLAPFWELATDSGEVRRSGHGVPPEVTRTLLERAHPLAEDQLAVIGTLNRGLENSRFGIVIWPAEDLDADEVNVFAAGFSGENTVYETVDPETGDLIRHILRKTKM